MTETETKMDYYMLLIGAHFNAILGKKYTAGDVIPSDSNLVTRFGSEKFRKLTKKEVVALEFDGEPAAIDAKPSVEEQRKRILKNKPAKKKKMKFTRT